MRIVGSSLEQFGPETPGQISEEGKEKEESG